MLAVRRIRSDPCHLEKHVRMTGMRATVFPGDRISLGYTVATLIGSDSISLGKTVAATQFPGDRFSCDTGIIAKHIGPLSADQIPTPAEMKKYLISYVPSASCI